IPLVVSNTPTQVVASADEATSTASNSEATTTNAATTETASTEATGTTTKVATTTTDSANDATASTSSAVLFQIVPEESTARFIIDEVLNGSPKTVVGTTDQVAGQLSVDAQNISETQIGVISINARTLTTDSDMRNRAISNRILYTDDYEYITFT